MSNPLPQAGGSYYALKDGTLQKAKWPKAQRAEVEKTPELPAEEMTETKETDNGK
jgi:hypothetical protein